jgi:salicylate hydroxylase
VEHPHIAIVGGGIGGLTAALSLQRVGMTVSIYERAPELREVGAGLVVTGSSMLGLELLGVADQVRAVAGQLRPRGYHYHDMRHYATGELFPGAEDSPGQPGSRAVHRADLHSILLDAVLANDPDCVHLDHEFASLTQSEAGVALTFTNGRTAEADAAIGADGVASAVRPSLFGDEPIVFTGKVSFRGLIPAELVTPEIAAEHGSFYVGPDRMFLSYFVRGTDFMNVVAHARQPGWEEEGWSIQAETEDLLALYDDFTERVKTIIRAIPPENLFKWALRDRPPRDRWTLGRVTLLGDAAHPMLPFLGQGANMAMEDGVVIGRCFEAAATVEEAFERYEAARKERANGAQNMSRHRAEELMRFEDEAAVETGRRGVAALYDPATVPV